MTQEEQQVEAGETVERQEESVPVHVPFYHRHKWLIRIVAVLVLVALGLGVAVNAAVQHRQKQEMLGLGAVQQPSAPVELEDSSNRTGAFTAHVEYTSMAETDGHQVATDIAWDDAWFFQDPTVYNHELATTCSVLSAIANSESGYYQAGSSSPAYMEEALAALGFQDISTASYQYRSEVFDEIVDFFAGTDDVVAYSVATKRVRNTDGVEKTLYLVSVRGSYGSEWLSDFNMGDSSDYEMDAIDHEGFMRAASEIVDDLADRLSETGGQDDIALLFTGHSRGAATANLAASYADDMTTGLRVLAPLENIYCYTFATPEVTEFANIGDSLYDNIFNIMNPSDIVPRLPLASWGYARYGNDLWLPGVGDAAFDDHYDAMRTAFKENVGTESPYVPEDRERVDKLVEDLGREIPTADDLTSVGGMVSLVRDLLGDINPMQVLYGHYPNVYIAWMQAIDADDLREGDAA
ncbi:lipase family protein [Collinsella tanakaei]|uniref:lipase family protein n=1 Tax=Collinsella tanakaei TaxID=626935 RepID=UPI0019569C4C|nr:lipase family protein [Collinsella tanakaei]MBM6778960.1 lipase family protein [Collinsella tanakaei]